MHCDFVCLWVSYFCFVGNLGYKNASQDLPGNAEASDSPTVAECYDYANKLVGGNYILDDNLGDNLYDVLDDEEEANDFPPNLSEFEAADISIQPQTTIDKARSDIFQQHKNEYRLIRRMISEENEAMGGGSEIKAVATLLLGPESHIYRVFQDQLKMPHHKFSHFMAALFPACRMNHNISKLWADDDFNTSRYMPPTVFNRVCRLMGECGLSRQFSLRFWEHLENAFSKIWKGTLMLNTCALLN